MRITVHIVDAFVNGDQGGNAAGVVLDAGHLSSVQKLKVAQAVGLSETAFVSPSSTASLKVEFFTPIRQIPHCGHATVATFSLCSQLGYLHDGEHRKESIDGILSLTTLKGQVTLHQVFPTFTTLAIDSQMGWRVLESIGVNASLVNVAYQLTVARSGNGFLLIPLTNENVLAGLCVNHVAIAQVCEELDLIGYYPFVISTVSPRQIATTRMFAPRYGIDEESATGTAAGPLGAYLISRSPESTTCLVEQGHFMNPPSPSLLLVSMDTKLHQFAPRVHVAGAGRVRKTMEIEVQ
jgi:PhzF family phenazine biosynthesis protein